MSLHHLSKRTALDYRISEMGFDTNSPAANAIRQYLAPPPFIDHHEYIIVVIRYKTTSLVTFMHQSNTVKTMTKLIDKGHIMNKGLYNK